MPETGLVVAGWAGDPRSAAGLYLATIGRGLFRFVPGVVASRDVRSFPDSAAKAKATCRSPPMSSEDHFRKLERMYASAPINAFFAPRLTRRRRAGGGLDHRTSRFLPRGARRPRLGLLQGPRRRRVLRGELPRHGRLRPHRDVQRLPHAPGDGGRHDGDRTRREPVEEPLRRGGGDRRRSWPKRRAGERLVHAKRDPAVPGGRLRVNGAGYGQPFFFERKTTPGDPRDRRRSLRNRHRYKIRPAIAAQRPRVSRRPLPRSAGGSIRPPRRGSRTPPRRPRRTSCPFAPPGSRTPLRLQVLLVAPVARQRVEDVRDGDDPRLERNLSRPRSPSG